MIALTVSAIAFLFSLVVFYVVAVPILCDWICEGCGRWVGKQADGWRRCKCGRGWKID